MSTFEDIYNLRQNFTVIGLTGRTGSGCSKFAELLSKSDLNSVKEISYFRNPIDFKTIKLKSDYYINDNFERKYNMVFDFITYKKRWKKYKVVKYRDVILFLILKEFCNDLDGLV